MRDFMRREKGERERERESSGRIVKADDKKFKLFPFLRFLQPGKVVMVLCWFFFCDVIGQMILGKRSFPREIKTFLLSYKEFNQQI